MKEQLFIYLLTFGGATLGLLRPFYGLLTYMSLSVLRPELLWSWSLHGDGNYSRIVGIALLLGWLIGLIGGMVKWQVGEAKPIVMLLIGYWIWIIVSASFSANQEVAWRYATLHSKILLPVLIGTSLVNTIGEIRILSWTLVICLGYLAYEAHGMYFGGRLAQFRDLGMLGMDNNSFSIAMASGVGLAIYVGFSEPNPVFKILAFLLAVLMVHVPMFGDSRGGMLGVLVVGIVTFIVLPKKTGLLVTYAVGVVVGLRLVGPSVWQRFSTTFVSAEQRDESAQSRFDLWADCWDVMLHHPLVGIGPDHWPLTAHLYGWPRGKEAHSLWFNCGAELGFVGLGLLLAFYMTTLYIVWHQLCRRSDIDKRLQHSGRMVIAALTGFMVSASFVSLDALELPFYIVLLAVSAIKLVGVEQLSRSVYYSPKRMPRTAVPIEASQT